MRPLACLDGDLKSSVSVADLILIMGLTPNMALRLSKLFGNSPDFWLNLQRAVDLWQTEKTEKAIRKESLGIRTLQTA